jgi:hypothetical protein
MEAAHSRLGALGSSVLPDESEAKALHCEKTPSAPESVTPAALTTREAQFRFAFDIIALSDLLVDLQ